MAHTNLATGLGTVDLFALSYSCSGPSASSNVNARHVYPNRCTEVSADSPASPILSPVRAWLDLAPSIPSPRVCLL